MIDELRINQQPGAYPMQMGIPMQ